VSVRARAPFIIVLSLAFALLGYAALTAWLGGYVAHTVAFAVVSAAAAVMAVRLAMYRGRVPEWSHRFEMTADGATGGVAARCNRCDTTVMLSPGTMTLPRVLTYAQLHTTASCEPRRLSDPESTRRLIPRPRSGGWKTGRDA
jgi:hypothetical protein